MKKTMFQKILEAVPAEIKKLVQRQSDIAIRIASILESKKIKQKDFALQIGMKESQLSKILSGNANLTLKTITKIEVALEEDIIGINVAEGNELKITSQSDYQEVFVYDISTGNPKYHELPENEYQEYNKMNMSFSEPSNAKLAN